MNCGKGSGEGLVGGWEKRATILVVTGMNPAHECIK